MPRVRINDLKQYAKALEVLTQVGGTWQGVGQKEWFLLVTEAQYRALVEANVVSLNESDKDHNHGTKPKKSAPL
jgi:hypothetical protein